MKVAAFTIRFCPIAIAFLLLFFGACRKDMPEFARPNEYYTGDFDQMFEAFWNGMNNNYLFWDIDTTDWNQVYRRYKPIFAQMDINDTADVRRSYTYFKTMTNGIIDGHYYISFSSSLLRDSGVINPANQRMLDSENFRNRINPNHFFNTIPQRYLQPGVSRAIVNNTPQGQIFAVSGDISNGIAYLYLNAFFVRANRVRSADYAATIDNFLNKLANPTTLRGIIIDVRNNGGGDLLDLDYLLGRMITEPLHFGYTKSKLDNNRLDYTPWTPASVNPVQGAHQITAPIVMLADRYSVSMSEITTMAVKALPNGHFIGERTWGGMGALTANIFYNGGQFATGFMNMVYTPSIQFSWLDNRSYEGVGFPPDQEIPVDLTAIGFGVDAQLEAAIQLINRQ